ncbi:MAG: DUF4150 domain-containing protein [Deltaproteobacteria bacterium]|nr:DUF4150 domain-containing protein [Deltaproteobacteria bacterium]
MAYAWDQVSPKSTPISSKQDGGKAVAATPDVCQTPPSSPAAPPGVLVPYPNNGAASDTTKGSKEVKVSGKEVQLKNKSYFKKSSGDEPGAHYLSDIEKSSETATDTEKVKIRGREVGLKSKDPLNDEYNHNPTP